MKKIISIVLSICLISTFSIVGYALDKTDYELKGTSITLDGSEDQTIEVVFSQAKEKNIIAFEGDFSTKETGNTSFFELTEFKSPVVLSGTNYCEVSSGKIVYADSALEGYAVEAGGTAMSVVYTVSKDTLAGTYTVQFNAINTQDWDLDQVENQTYTAEITVTRNEPSVTTGYAVALSSDASSAGVAKGSSFNVNLDVSNSDSTVTGFNAFSGTLSYDTSKVSYTGSDTIDEFGVQNDSNTGTLKITRADKNVDIIKNPDLSLNFTANAAGEAKFELTSASVKVDAAANAESQNAPVAAISGSPLTVQVLPTYTTTFKGGDGATGDAPTMDAAAAGAKIELPGNTFTKDGWNFSKWNDGTSDYEAGAEYTMPDKDVTFTAQWTEDIVVTPVTANPSAYFGSQYKLIAATINASSGYIPTYKGEEMFLVQGYDENTYYYVIDGDYDSTQFAYKAETAVSIAKPDNDVNQTGTVDINDAQFVYNIYNGAPPTKNIVQRLLLADTNRDKTVNTQDCAVVVGAI
jgi:hypothetical protein